MDYANS